MKYLSPSTELDARAVQFAQDRLTGFPSTEHTHVGRGPHYTPPDGIFTRTFAEPIKHPTLDQWTIPLGFIREMVEDSTRLTAIQKQRLLDAIDNALEQLDETWTPDSSLP